MPLGQLRGETRNIQNIPRRYSLDELEALPTLSVGQADSLKVEKKGEWRVWLSRCHKEDGEPYNNKVTVEAWDGKRWINASEYEAV